MKSVTLRPTGWESPAEKQRAYRARCQAQRQLVADLLHAVRNAHWDEPELARTMREGTETDVLTALIVHYRARHWGLRDPTAAGPAAAEPTARGAIKAKM